VENLFQALHHQLNILLLLVAVEQPAEQVERVVF